MIRELRIRVYAMAQGASGWLAKAGGNKFNGGAGLKNAPTSRGTGMFAKRPVGR